jgi:hypothetical protein
MAPVVRNAGPARSLIAAPFAVAVATAFLVPTACAQPAAAAASAAGFDARLLVKLTHPSDDTAAIVAEAARQAGVPVSYAASVSAAWHALSLHCSDAAACDAAIARLRSSGGYLVVEPDGRKQRAVM